MAAEVIKARAKTSQAGHRPQAAAGEIRSPQNGNAAEKQSTKGVSKTWECR